jgi:hypothetical protein
MLAQHSATIQALSRIDLLAKLHPFGKRNDNQLNFYKHNSRSFGCCPSRNLGNFARRQRLKCVPVWGVLKAFSCRRSEVPVMGRK